MADPLDCAIDMMRRLPPRNVADNLPLLTALCPDLEDEILSSVDQPLRSMRCPLTSRNFLICDYNRDGNSYRSPYANEYTPPLESSVLPSEPLRQLEVTANAAFETYRELYFEGGLSSVYLWDLEEGFAGVVLLQKKVDNSMESYSGTWDSIHIYEVLHSAGKKSATYKLTSTIMLYLLKTETIAQAEQAAKAEQQGVALTPAQAQAQTQAIAALGSGNLNLCGSITRQTKKELPLDDSNTHLTNMGTMVEAMESQLRDILTSVYFERSRDVISRLRTQTPANSMVSPGRSDQVRSELLSRLAMTGRKLP